MTAKSNKWYASTASSGGVSAGVSQHNGTFAIPGVPVTGGANALTVTVTDVSGNIATQVVNVTVVNGEPVSIGYDANGNQTNHNEWGMTYDRENRLVSATSASLAVSYRYDALGRLIERIAGNSTNRMYYAGWQLIAEYDGTGTLQRKYVYGPGIDEPIRMTSGGANYYYHADGLGSVTEITDGTGNLVERYRYDVYGAPTFYNASGVVTNGSTIGNRLLFTARDRDPDTGWYNYRYRYYNSSLGRFAQPDPISIRGGVNQYVFCQNNPASFVDPTGLCADPLDEWYRDALTNLQLGALGLLKSPFTLLRDFNPISLINRGAETLGALSADPLGAISDLVRGIPDRFQQWASDPEAIGQTVGEAGILLGIGTALETTGAANGGASSARSLSDRIRDFQQNPKDWVRVSTSAEQATARSAKGGISLETTYRNKITGEVIHIHDVYKSSGAQIPNHPSYRDFGKGN
jgi:RHS repeat-associated protein